jgi:hypothetical protein
MKCVACGAFAVAVLCVFTALGSGCGSSNTSTGTASGACTFTLYVPQCQSYSGSQQTVTGSVNACVNVFAGIAVGSCSTVGVVGYCKNVSQPDSSETSEIFYYSADAGVLTLQDLCTNSGGTYSSTP